MIKRSAWLVPVVAVVAGVMLAGCASTEETDEVSAADSNTMYEESTAKTDRYECPAGYVLQCETKRVGRIRFNSIGKGNIESCSCEVYQGMPTQSPLPGIQ